MSNENEIMTPVGRLVRGHPMIPGDPKPIKTGPNAGQMRQEYYVALAIPKTNPGFPAIMAKITAEARAGFPHLFNPDGSCLKPDFAFKITDGDSTVPNTKGVAPCTREGYAGNWVLNFSNGYAPQCLNRAGAVISNTEEIKCGYYIRILGTVKNNQPKNGAVQQSPGVYLNLSGVELCGFGPEINFGPDAKAAFQAAPAALPAGASPTPIAPPAAPGFAPPPAPGFAPPPAPGFAPPPAPGFAPPPVPGFAPPPAPLPAPAPAPLPVPAPDFLNPQYRAPDGRTYGAQQLLGAGYTQPQIDALPRA